MPRQRELKFPKLRATASVVPATLNEDARTLEVVFYSGATVHQGGSFFEDPFELTFELSKKAVRLERFNNGAPLVDNHATHGSVSEVVLGVVEKAWLEGDSGRARVKIAADRPDIIARVKDGILRNFSMGARVHQMRDVTQKGDLQKKFLAIDWEPHELSIVPVNADPGAQALSLASSEVFSCTLSLGADAPTLEDTMKIKVRLLSSNETVEIEEGAFDVKLHSKDLTVPAPGPAPSNVVDLRAAKRAVDDRIEADRAFQTEVKRLAAHYNLPTTWADHHIKLGTTMEQILEDATTQRAKLAPHIDGSIRMGDDWESGQARFDMMRDAIVARAKSKPVPESARQYARMSLVEMAHERVCLTSPEAKSLNPRYDQRRVVELALTRADFPNLLADSANKVLMGDYEQAPVTYRRLAARQDLPDFKTASVLKVGDFPIPLLVGESGEIKLGSFSEAKDTFALATYARRLAFSYQAIVNDDLASFGRVMGSYGRRLADFENGLWFSQLISASGAGPTLGDGGALFNATAVTTAGGHANLTASGTAISVDSIGVGRAMMKKQTSLDGIKLNINPTILLTSPDKETIARQFTTVLGPNLAAGSQNPWAGTLEPIADANLSSANPWYLFADPSIAPVSVYGYLEGQTGPDVASRVGFEYLGVELRVALHFGIGWVDFRGGYRNAGA